MTASSKSSAIVFRVNHVPSSAAEQGAAISPHPARFLLPAFSCNELDVCAAIAVEPGDASDQTNKGNF